MESPKPVPAPWVLRGTIYTLATYISPKVAASMSKNKEFLYAPLERNSSFSEGKMVGGLGMTQVIRYTESPVGPYDELVVVPGRFEWEDAKNIKRRNVRVTRIYVSQKETCWNGRKNWNIPKHLADFKFTTLEDGTISIKVLPFSRNVSGEEVLKPSAPLFSATFKPIPYLPSFPLSTGVAKWVGMDLALVQPPLPKGTSAYGELVGTEEDGWVKVVPREWSRRSSVGWWNFPGGEDRGGETEALLNGPGPSQDEAAGERFEKWWPGLGKWNVGVVMEDAVIEFPIAERWT